MKTKTLLRALLLALVVVVAGCRGDDDDDDGSTAATCPSICAQQDRLCGTTTDCASLCSQLGDIVAKSGCTAENQAGLDCLAEKNVCDKDETVCPSTDLTACIDAYCVTSSGDSFCQ